MKKNALIVSAFPATGKTYFCEHIAKEKGLLALDSDSSNFSWTKDKQGNNTKERNPNFPQNYIEHIKENIGKVDIIFVSSHEAVRNALKDADIKFTLVFPAPELKEEYLERFIARGNNRSFVDFISSNWDEFIKGCFSQKGCMKLPMSSGRFLSDYFSDFFSIKSSCHIKQGVFNVMRIIKKAVTKEEEEQIDYVQLEQEWTELFEYIENKGIVLGLQIARKNWGKGSLNDLIEEEKNYQDLISIFEEN